MKKIYYYIISILYLIIAFEYILYSKEEDIAIQNLVNNMFRVIFFTLSLLILRYGYLYFSGKASNLEQKKLYNKIIIVSIIIGVSIFMKSIVSFLINCPCGF